jgi:hypothetical protein
MHNSPSLMQSSDDNQRILNDSNDDIHVSAPLSNIVYDNNNASSENGQNLDKVYLNSILTNKIFIGIFV